MALKTQGKQMIITVDINTGKVTEVKTESGAVVEGQANPFPIDNFKIKNAGSFSFVKSNPCFWFFDGVQWYVVCS